MRLVIICVLLAASGCAILPDRLTGARPDATAAPGDLGAVPPTRRPDQVPPPAGADTVEEFDTTSAAERAEAAKAAPEAGERLLGQTVAALGNPADPGFWLETPLVTTIVQGRVEALVNGQSVALDLRPSGGEAGSGSRISLPALRLLGVGIAGLHEVKVFAP